MTLVHLMTYTTIQGNVKLTMWKPDGSIAYEDTIEGTEDLAHEPIHLWDPQEVKYIFAGDDGYLHIDFEWERE